MGALNAVQDTLVKMEYVKNVLEPLDLIVQPHAKVISLDIYVKINVTVPPMKLAIDTSVVNPLFSDEMDSSAECHNTMLLLVIGSGSTMLSLALLFVGVMFYRWHTILQSNLHPIIIPRGFQVDLLPFSGNHEVFQENYDDIRESRMLLADKGNCHRETIENRLSSTDYSHLFLKGRTSRKSISEMPEQYYSAIDARFKSKMPLVMMSEFPEDDCYVSVSQLARQNKRISKSCSDLKIDMSDTHHDIYSNQWRKAKGDTNNQTILIEHL